MGTEMDSEKTGDASATAYFCRMYQSRRMDGDFFSGLLLLLDFTEFPLRAYLCRVWDRDTVQLISRRESGKDGDARGSLDCALAKEVLRLLDGEAGVRRELAESGSYSEEEAWAAAESELEQKLREQADACVDLMAAYYEFPAGMAGHPVLRLELLKREVYCRHLAEAFDRCLRTSVAETLEIGTPKQRLSDRAGILMAGAPVGLTCAENYVRRQCGSVMGAWDPRFAAAALKEGRPFVLNEGGRLLRQKALRVTEGFPYEFGLIVGGALEDGDYREWELPLIREGEEPEEYLEPVYQAEPVMVERQGLEQVLVRWYQKAGTTGRIFALEQNAAELLPLQEGLERELFSVGFSLAADRIPRLWFRSERGEARSAELNTAGIVVTGSPG